MVISHLLNGMILQVGANFHAAWASSDGWCPVPAIHRAARPSENRSNRGPKCQAHLSSQWHFVMANIHHFWGFGTLQGDLTYPTEREVGKIIFKMPIFGGYVSSLDGSCLNLYCLQGLRFAKNPGPPIASWEKVTPIASWEKVTCPPGHRFSTLFFWSSFGQWWCRLILFQGNWWGEAYQPSPNNDIQKNVGKL